jgi:hypothetical protein
MDPEDLGGLGEIPVRVGEHARNETPLEFPGRFGKANAFLDHFFN